MANVISRVDHYMTKKPKTVEKNTPLIEALNLMRKEEIRHLPVMDGGAIAGILTMSDIRILDSLRGVDLTQLKVSDAYHADPMTVKSGTDLNEVVREMAAHKYGCMLIRDREKLVGIFTWVDALNALGNILDKNYDQAA